MQAGQASSLVPNTAANVAARVNLVTSVIGVLLAIVVGADVPDRQQARIAGGAAKSTDPGGRADRFPRRTVAKLDQRFQRPAVRQSQDPEELRSAATFVKIHSYRLLLLFAHLPEMRPRSPMKVEDSVAFRAQIAADVTLDNGRGLVVVVIAACRLNEESRSRSFSILSHARLTTRSYPGRRRLSLGASPLTRRQSLHVVRVQDAQRSER